MSKVILGIDPGSRHTGYAVLSKRDGNLAVLRCDVLSMAKMDDHSRRLQYIFDKISGIVKSIQPDACAVETPVYGVDPLAMLKLGRAQAAAMLAVTSCDIPVAEYYPKAIKKSITGNGNADKKQVAFMLEKVVQLPDEKLSDDATDALAVAWCHFMKQDSPRNTSDATKKRHQNRSSSSWSNFVKNNPDRVNG